ncbi:hypothetical protein ACF08N_21135 [Streptomyces sp. NPDC015127]|uniref:hypothetical protein n=1 Tax=Streptomyces sp. NPDC015127 TaxID=3364939 RepID=UPI0036F5349F
MGGYVYTPSPTWQTMLALVSQRIPELPDHATAQVATEALHVALACNVRQEALRPLMP